MAKKLKQTIVVSLLLFVCLLPLSATRVHAACAAGETCGGGGTPAVVDNGSGSSANTSATGACNNTTSGGTVDQSKVNQCLSQSPIVGDIQQVVNFLSAGVGIIVIAVIIIGGIQYTLAGDNPQALTAAKQRITNGLIALAAFFLIFALLQWLIPGGVFS